MRFYLAADTVHRVCGRQTSHPRPSHRRRADSWGSDCSFEDTDGNGYDDVSYEAGAESGDLNLDGTDDILDIVALVNQILNP